MKLTTVKEALDASEDEIILAIRGQLVKLWEMTEGDGQYGRWTLQSGTLKDSTGEIKVNFSNRDVVPKNWRGKVVEIRATKKEKGGWSGCKRSVDNRKNNILQVTGSAEVFLFEQEHQPEPDGGEPNGQAKAPSGPQGASQPAPKGGTAAGQENGPKKPVETMAEKMAVGMGYLYQLANTQYAAIRTVKEYLVPLLKEKGINLDPVQESTLIQNMLIQCYFEKHHWNFPQKRFPEGKPTDATD